ncbi:hypothetical protein [Stakelama saccharophila]|uniref:Protein TonB n=1 Tax=Stakelama saccharophila TaxID=3075605 RepID=A0ABZ0BBY8_9SPHN|nr:hypothetical protein [Stakelama sp. W311]WNO54952.1 hypothetical protein RPR59_06825 [Stakelama sp. W311]
MVQLPRLLQHFPDAVRSRLGTRLSGALLALLIEILLALLLLTLAGPAMREEPPESTVLQFYTPEDAVEKNADAGKPTPADADRAQPEPAERSEAAQPQPQPERQPMPPQPPPPEPQPEQAKEPPAFIPISPDQMASIDLSNRNPSKPKTAPAQPYGPVANPLYAATAGDTPRVAGSGPHGEPLYAASWYREPRDDELRGYLSAAKGPGWALIACKTAPRFRVEDCVSVDEYPDHSGIAQAVLAAAYQFRVRPPRIGGKSQVGAWVRIRIDYDLQRSPSGAN